MSLPFAHLCLSEILFSSNLTIELNSFNQGVGQDLETRLPRLERGRILPPMLRTLQLLLHSPGPGPGLRVSQKTLTAATDQVESVWQG